MNDLAKFISAAAVVLALIIAAEFHGRSVGSSGQKLKDDEAAAKLVDAKLDSAKKVKDSVVRSFRQAATIVAKDRPAHQKATARTDSALIVAQEAREAALRAAADSASARTELLARIDSLARADSILAARTLEERARAAKQIQDDSIAIAQADDALEKTEAALDVAQEQHKADQTIIGDLKSQRHNIFRRAIGGVLTVTAAATCGALGSLAGPAGAVAGAVVCGAAGGAIF